MANDENLRNVAVLPADERRAFAASGGKAGKGSMKKSLAKRLYWLKQKGLTDENCEHIYEVLQHPEMSALDSRVFLESLKNKCSSVDQKMKLAQLFLNWHKVHFGEKSLNLNIDVSSEIKSLKEFLTGEPDEDK